MRIRPYEPRDEAELLAFRRRIFPDAPYKGDRDYFRWAFDRNPLGSSLGAFLIMVDDERIVGAMAALRQRLRVGGAWHDCVWLVDLVIDPTFRGGLALWQFFRRAMAASPITLTTGVTPGTERVYDALGWAQLRVTRSKYCIVRPTRLLSLAHSTTGTPARPGAALRLALPIADCLLPAAGRVLASAARLGPGAGAVERVARLDAAWDEDLARLSACCGVTEYRTAATLNWKLAERPVGRQEILALRHAHGGLRGTIALKWMMRPGVARWVEIADYLVDPRDVAGFRRLVRAALVRAAVARPGARGIDFVRFRVGRPDHAALLRAPLWVDHTRPITDDVFAYSPDRALLEAMRASPWHITALAGDRLDTGRDEWPASAERDDAT